ncbi:MAG TPA: VOC family protein [Steroidobacteraceae bacterium]|nr:VOC family protein [Steroidobacteraceae bacterium]
MKYLISAFASLCLLFSFVLTRAQAPEPTQNIERFGLYVVVADLSKAQTFYEQLFQKKPYVTNDRLVGFDVAGGLFAVFAQKGLDRKANRGDSTVPYLRIKDIDAEFARLKKAGFKLLDAAVVREGPIALFRCSDPDGNVIEFFSTAPPR